MASRSVAVGLSKGRMVAKRARAVRPGERKGVRSANVNTHFKLRVIYFSRRTETGETCENYPRTNS